MNPLENRAIYHNFHLTIKHKMKENRFAIFLANLLGLAEFSRTEVYRLEKNRWVDSNKKLAPREFISHSELIAATEERIIKFGETKRIFVVPTRDTVAVLEIPKRTRIKTLQHYLSRFDESFDAASTTYHALYDELTGVLNRRGIGRNLELALNAPSTMAGQPESFNKQISSQANITLFSFDVDRFKSVNDTYGHDVGDIVLASFASRLNSTVINLSSNYHAKFIFGRPGGEEFELIAVGSISPQERVELGESLLNEIRKEFKPEGNGQELFSKKTKRVQLPNLITSSIGVALAQAPSTTEKVSEVLNTLRKQADTALYRAKADGRNCLRTYADIRLKHGRVIGFYADSQLVQIDIGSEVGVRPGQTYAVNFPPFTGAEAVKGTDSGARVLGTYPEVASAIIKVIEVDNEVSTAIISDRAGVTVVPVGSRLQYVFEGSLPTFPPTTFHVNSVISKTQDLFQYIKYLSGIKKQFCVISFRYCPSDDEKRRQNVILDEIFSLMHIILPPASRIFYGLGCGSYAVLQTEKGDITNVVEQFLKSIIENIEKVGIKLFAGNCNPKGLPPEFSTEPEALVFYAETALKSLEGGEDKYVTFNQWTPVDTLEAWRKERQTEHAIADYQNFRRYGFDSSGLHNHIGLLIAESDSTERYSIAEAAFTRATDSDSSEKSYRANLAILQALQGRFSEAYDNFTQSLEFTLEEASVYSLTLGKCILMKSEKNLYTGEFTRIQMLEKAVSSFGIAPSRRPFDLWWQEVKSEIDSSRNSTVSRKK